MRGDLYIFFNAAFMRPNLTFHCLNAIVPTRDVMENSSSGIRLSQSDGIFQKYVREYFAQIPAAKSVSIGFRSKLAPLEQNQFEFEFEFEFDVMVQWDEYLFIFECKDRRINGFSAMTCAWFDDEVNKAVDQVLRQADGVRDFPDKIKTRNKPRRSYCSPLPSLLFAVFGASNT